MESIIVDTGFWYAVFDSRDSHHTAATSKADVLDICSVVVPWPTLYEVLRTKMVRNSLALQGFERSMKKPNIVFIDDSSYRESALELSLESSLRRHRPLSLIDCLIRIMLEDTNVRIDYLATFNAPDFSDLCYKFGIEMI